MVGPWPPLKGGIVTFMLNVVNSPVRENYRFIRFNTGRPPKHILNGDNYGYLAIFKGGLKRVFQGIFITLWHLLSFPVVVIARGPDLVQIHASDFQVFWESALYLLMAEALRRPVAFRIGGSFNVFYGSSSPRIRQLIAWFVRRPRLVIVQSGYWRDYITEVGRKGEIAVLPNFVRSHLLQESRDEDSDHVRFLLYAGENARLKGVYVLFAAARQLRQRGVHCSIRLLGVTSSLGEEIRAEGLADFVEPLGFLDHDDVLATLRRTDVFLQISYSEGFPNTLLEAMASGVAAIVTPVGAIPEVVGADGDAAFFIMPGDDAALAKLMTGFIQDPQLLRRMQARARAIIAERFTDAVIAPVLDTTWRRAIALQREPASRKA